MSHRFCTNCGNELSGGNFCTNCGHPTLRDDTDAAPPRETSYEMRCEILAELWPKARDDDHLVALLDFGDLGYPLAYSIYTGIVPSTDAATEYVNETFESVLRTLEIEDGGFESLDDLFIAGGLASKVSGAPPESAPPTQESATMHLNADDTEDLETLREEFQDFVNEFKPLPAPDGSSGHLVSPEQTDKVAELDDHLVWTVLWVEDRVVMPGFTPSAINGGPGSSDVSGYIICEQPWDALDADSQVIYERQYTCDLCEGAGCDACDDSGFYWGECFG